MADYSEARHGRSEYADREDRPQLRAISNEYSVMSQLAGLSKELEILSNGLVDFEQRLEPVLGPPRSDMAKDESDTMKTSHSEAVEAIIVLRSRVRSLADRVAYTADRVQI